jgi:hypothetical protein
MLSIARSNALEQTARVKGRDEEERIQTEYRPRKKRLNPEGSE